MTTTPSLLRVSLARRSDAALLVARLTEDGMAQSFTGDPARRKIGLLGELAASLYLFGSDVPWLLARERQAGGQPTCDLYPYHGLEVKTLACPTHVWLPVSAAFRGDEDLFFVRYLGPDTDDAPAFELLGWLTAHAARTIWSIGKDTFTNGVQRIPVGCQSPPDSCPWRFIHE